MKKNIFIIVSAILVIVLLVVWVYVLFFSKPNSDQSFSLFDFGGSSETTSPTASTTPEEALLNVTKDKKLLQLTTEPTAGYRELDGANDQAKVLYIKAGTGHIYEINLASGEEKQITSNTIPLARFGEFSSDGQFVLIQAVSGNQSTFMLGHLDNSTTHLTTTPVEEKIVSFKATTDNKFLYAARAGFELVGKEYNPTTNTAKTLFTVPFLEATIVWGATAADTHYIYPKASTELEGYLYAAEKGVLQRQPVAGYGLAAVGNNQAVIYSRQVGETYQTFFYNRVTKKNTPVKFTLLPEKCTRADTTNTFICGEAITDYNYLLPDSWYQGTQSFSDMLWSVNTDSNEVRLLSDVSGDSGRELDIIRPSVNQAGGNIYFINKNNQTLWLYRQ